MRFEDDIKPLFREGDRNAMRFAFDLGSLDDVSTNADAILDRLEAGTMPCDGAWPAEQSPCSAGGSTRANPHKPSPASLSIVETRRFTSDERNCRNTTEATCSYSRSAAPRIGASHAALRYRIEARPAARRDIGSRPPSAVNRRARQGHGVGSLKS